MIKVGIENFTKNELECKCCAKFVLDSEMLIALQGFRYYLNRRYKRNIRLIPTCSTRCEKHNKDVGGSKSSYHLTGQAVDLYSPDINHKQLYTEAVNCKLFSTVIRYDKSLFIHLDTRKRPNYAIKHWAWMK